MPLLWAQSWSYLGPSASQGTALPLSGVGKCIDTDFARGIPKVLACIFVALRSYVLDVGSWGVQGTNQTFGGINDV